MTAARPAPEPRVGVDGVTKAFGRAAVLRGIQLEIRAGEVLGLVGENGAGKSTLMNVLGGSVRPDAGTLRLDGLPYAPRGPADARAAGIAFVHQELTLFPNLTIAENLHIAALPRRPLRPWIDRAAAAAATRALLARVGLAHHPDTMVDRLSAGERQLVEIGRAVGAQARVLILDEPTTSLGASDRDRLHGLVRELAASGLSVIYISHELGDVRRICDRIAVLRDGAVVATGPPAALPIDTLVRLMVGREVGYLYPPRRPGPPAREPLLEARRLDEPGVVRDVSFTLHRGEILGVFGLLGAGRSELARIIFGLDRHASGEVRLAGAALAGGPAGRIAEGLAFVTEDRRLDGLCLDASIARNLQLVHLDACCRGPVGVLDARRAEALVAAATRDVRLTGSPGLEQPVGRLSGGNQQKVVLAKWLAAPPRVLILDEPTRGIDVGARAEVYQLLHRLAAGGTGLLIISSELDELIGLCDRLLVMRAGEISAEFEAGRFDREHLLRAALPARVS